MLSHTHSLAFTGTEVRKTYVKWDRGEPDREWTCLSLLQRHAPGVAPKPLRRELCDGAPVIVMERLPGEPLGGAPLTTEQTASLGRTLRRLYTIPLTAIESAQLGERLNGPTTQRQTVTSSLHQTHDLADCQDPDLVRDSLQAAASWLALPESLPRPRLATMGISDLNPTNILWDGLTCRLVDFEDGGLTDPSYELADHVEHIAGRLTGVYDAEKLVDAVGLSPDGRDRMHRYQILWSAFWLAMLLPGNPGFSRNPPGTTECQATHVLQLLP